MSIRASSHGPPTRCVHGDSTRGPRCATSRSSSCRATTLRRRRWPTRSRRVSPRWRARGPTRSAGRVRRASSSRAGSGRRRRCRRSRSTMRRRGRSSRVIPITPISSRSCCDARRESRATKRRRRARCSNATRRCGRSTRSRIESGRGSRLAAATSPRAATRSRSSISASSMSAPTRTTSTRSRSPGTAAPRAISPVRSTQPSERCA